MSMAKNCQEVQFRNASLDWTDSILWNQMKWNEFEKNKSFYSNIHSHFFPHSLPFPPLSIRKNHKKNWEEECEQSGSRKQFQHDPLKTNHSLLQHPLYSSLHHLLYSISSFHPFPVNWKEWKSFFSKTGKADIFEGYTTKTKRNKASNEIGKKSLSFVPSIIEILRFKIILHWKDEREEKSIAF